MRGLMAAVLIASVGCDRQEGPAPLVPPGSSNPRIPAPPGPQVAPMPDPANKKPPPSKPEGEPSRIVVHHVLIAFKGAERAGPKVTRTKEEARILAEEILQRAKNGEDIAALAK